MEYSIRELSRLAGVTTRTLRWYDRIGLLKPSRTGDNGLRWYGPAEVDRLQDILYYRALGVELAQIRTCLDAPGFDRLTALQSHLERLRAERARLDGLIQSVEDTIGCQERNEIMNDGQKFEAFKRTAVAEQETAYGAEARKKYGNGPVEEVNAVLLAETPEQFRDREELEREVQRQLEEAVLAGASPEGEAGQCISGLHRRWLTAAMGSYHAARHRGIAALYTEDPRFTLYYDKKVPGCAAFLRDAVLVWIK